LQVQAGMHEGRTGKIAAFKSSYDMSQCAQDAGLNPQRNSLLDGETCCVLAYDGYKLRSQA